MYKRTRECVRDERLRPALFALCGCALSLALPGAAATNATNTYTAYADVVKVEPVVEERASLDQNCDATQARAFRDNYRRYRDLEEDRPKRRVLPTVIGSLIGGAIGNQFGGGAGRKIFTAIGAIAGASVANGSSHRRHRHENDPYAGYNIDQHECEPTTTQVHTGYLVTYRYDGRLYTSRMEDHPGDRVRVTVRVADNQAAER